MKKTTSENLSKRLTQYGTLSLAIAGIADVNGQVSGPTVVNADIVAETPYNLNVDGDTVVDFKLNLNGNNLFASGVAPNAEILGFSSIPYSSTYRFPYALNNGDIISNNAPGTWFNESYQTMNYSSCSYGVWCNVTDKYLGLRFDIAGIRHYGWARLTVDMYAPNGVTLIEYYYNPYDNEPDGIGDPVNAGQQALGIDDNKLNEIKVVALNKSIALFNLPKLINYRVFNMSGQTVLEGKISTDTHVVEANTLSNGIYIIELKDNDSNAVVRKKIVL
jgi:hypothetical protein